MKRRLPIFIVLAVVVAVAAYFYPRFRKKPQAENEIVLSGNIEAHESLVSFKVPGRIIELPVEEGQSVAPEHCLRTWKMRTTGKEYGSMRPASTSGNPIWP
jgi:multidrug efflux pump subunit AcrA (membrane-fusion protein)